MQRCCLPLPTCLTLLLVASLGPSIPTRAVQAQEVLQPIIDVGIGFSLGFPQGEFKREVPERAAIGGSGYFAYRLGGGPLMVGGDIGYLIYGHDVRREPFLRVK